MSAHIETAQAHTEPPQFELLVLQYRGLEVDFCWAWPPGESQVVLAQVLAAVEGVEAAFVAQLQACSLQRVEAGVQAVWQLAHGSAELVCSVNGKALAAGSALRLAHGDEIELGLMRLLVAMQPSDAFVLTDLDTQPGPVAARPDAEREGLARSDFTDLIALEPQESVPAPAQQAQPRSSAEAAPSSQDPLAVLHARYLAKLRNPALAEAEDHWQDLVRAEQLRQGDPMQQWMQAAGASPGLDDLLGQQHSIASVLESLDALGGSDVLAPEPFDSVMHLFAPENLRAQESLQSLVQHSLPGLSQREHHSMALDSAMPFVGGEAAFASSPKR